VDSVEPEKVLHAFAREPADLEIEIVEEIG
jgi:hypothetical protein